MIASMKPADGRKNRAYKEIGVDLDAELCRQREQRAIGLQVVIAGIDLY